MKISDDVLLQQIKRLNELKNMIIILFSDELDYDGDRDFVITDALFKHLTNGDLNNYYQSPLLEEYDKSERDRVLNIINKYSFLLFRNKNCSSWFESIDMPLIDYDIIALKLLDYYEFLIDIYLQGGEIALKELTKYVDYDIFNETSVIDYLISSFASKDILKKVIIDMSKEDGPYKDFSIDNRAILLKKPNGIFYYTKNNSIILIDPIDLVFNVSQIDGDFEEVINIISDQYL